MHGRASHPVTLCRIVIAEDRQMDRVLHEDPPISAPCNAELFPVRTFGRRFHFQPSKQAITWSRRSWLSTTTMRQGWLLPTEGARSANCNRRSSCPVGNGSVLKRRTSRRHFSRSSKSRRKSSVKHGRLTSFVGSSCHSRSVSGKFHKSGGQERSVPPASCVLQGPAGRQ